MILGPPKHVHVAMYFSYLERYGMTGELIQKTDTNKTIQNKYTYSYYILQLMIYYITFKIL